MHALGNLPRGVSRDLADHDVLSDKVPRDSSNRNSFGTKAAKANGRAGGVAERTSASGTSVP